MPRVFEVTKHLDHNTPLLSEIDLFLSYVLRGNHSILFPKGYTINSALSQWFKYRHRFHRSIMIHPKFIIPKIPDT